MYKNQPFIYVLVVVNYTLLELGFLIQGLIYFYICPEEVPNLVRGHKGRSYIVPNPVFQFGPSG